MNDPDNYNQLNENDFISRKSLLRIYVTMTWLMTILILLTITKLATYEDIKYFFWIISVLIPLLYLLYLKRIPDQLSKKEGRREIFIIACSFIVLILTLLVAILVGR